MNKELEELEELIEITTENLKEINDEEQITEQENYLHELIQRKQKLKFSFQRTAIPKQYTVREWNRFEWGIQEELCKRFNIILVEKTKDGEIIPPRKTLREVIQHARENKKDTAIKVLKNINKRNLDKGIKIIHKTTDQISDFSNRIGTQKRSSFF